MVETYLLEQLVAVRRHGTLIAAAESLHISQPALSKSMKKLETLVDMPLFIRGNRKIELNDTGRFFADRAAEFLAQGESMLEQVYGYDRNLHNISVGACVPILFWELSPVLSALFPNMSVTTRTEDDERLLKGLSRGHYQLVVTSYDPGDEDLVCIKFRTESLSLSVPKSHPFYDRESITPEELNGQFLIVFNEIGLWDQWIRKYFPGIHLMTVSDPEALRDAIGLGAALSFVSDYVVGMGYYNSGQKIIPLDMEDKSLSYYLICRKQDFSKYRKMYQRLGLS